MTDKEKLKLIMDNTPDWYSFEGIVGEYLARYTTEMSHTRAAELMSLVYDLIEHKSREAEYLKSVAYERAVYLEAYLSGEMWMDEESAKRNIEPQIKNARAIQAACKGLQGMFE